MGSYEDYEAFQKKLAHVMGFKPSLEKHGPSKKQLSYRKKVSAKSKVVKKHSRVKDLPKSATKHAKGASLLTRRIPGATLS